LLNSPLVSVIVPNYNHAPYLRERIDSILNQTFQDFELILLDDCSTDDSRDILRSYQNHPKVSHVVLNEQNTGNTFLQWHRGINLAQGELIWMAESDDVAEAQLLETLAGELAANTAAVVAFCHSQMIDKDGQPMTLNWHKHGSNGQTLTYDGTWYLRHRMLVRNQIYNASMAVFRKSVFPLIPTDYQYYRYSGDWLFWNYVCQHGQVVEVCRVLSRFRQHPQKVTASSQQDGRQWRDIAGILRQTATLAHLNALQRRCLCGRWTKRFQKAEDHSHPDIATEFSDLYGGSSLDICLYEAGKLIGFLKD
jgi:glycosyltransferase involved in cell wall biosynthesis